jgi:uncharacterized membrane protein
MRKETHFNSPPVGARRPVAVTPFEAIAARACTITVATVLSICLIVWTVVSVVEKDKIVFAVNLLAKIGDVTEYKWLVVAAVNVDKVTRP